MNAPRVFTPIAGSCSRPERPSWWRMIALWSVLGLLVGACIGAESTRDVGLISGMVAGALVLGTLGGLFRLTGGEPRGSMLGAALGVILGAGAAVVLRGPSFLIAGTERGLLLGAIAGATMRPYSRYVRARMSLTYRILGAVVTPLLKARRQRRTERDAARSKARLAA